MNAASFYARDTSRIERWCAVAALVLLALSWCGCGATALQRSTTAATVTHALLEGSATTIEAVCSIERVEASETPQERATACLRAAEGYDVAAAAWTTWAAALLAAAEDDEALAAAQRLAGPVVRFLAELAELLQSAGVDVPAVPEWLVAFAGGAS